MASFAFAVLLFAPVLQGDRTRIDGVEAIVGSRVVTTGDLERAFQATLARTGALSTGEEALLRRQLLARLANDLLLVQWARGAGIDPAVVEAQVAAEIELRTATAEDRRDLREELHRIGLSMEQWRGEVADQTWLRTLMRYETGLGPETRTSIYVSPREVWEAYRDHPERFRLPSRVRGSQILLSHARYGGEEGARAEAKRILRDLAAGKTTFEREAGRWSDWRPEEGGDLGGWITEEDTRGLDRRITDALLTADPGTPVGPVALGAGLSLVLATERAEAKAITLKEAAPILRQELNRARLAAHQTALQRKLLRQKFYVWPEDLL